METETSDGAGTRGVGSVEVKKQPKKNWTTKEVEAVTVSPSAVSPIHKKLLAIKRDIGAIAKDRKGDGIRYTYRGIDDVYNALHGAMIEHGVMHYPQVIPGTYVREVKELLSKDGRSRLQSQVGFILAVEFIDVDSGTGVRITAPAEGYDDSDKASGKACSYGMKNALAHMFGIPTAVEEPDHERPDTGQDPEAVITRVVQQMTVAGSMEAVMKAYDAAPPYAQKHKEVVNAGTAARARFGK